MSVTISVKFDVAPVRRFFDDLVERQIPFATATALTSVAFAARRELVADLPRHFTIRSTWLTKGIRVEKATKTRLEASVGSVDPFMRLQAEGGEKRPRGRLVGVPVGARPARTDRTPRSKWPGAIARRRASFFRMLPSGNLALFGGRRGEEPSLQYVLTRAVKVKPRWPLADTVAAVVADRWPNEARKALERAARTATR